jgi:hypothetical protein
MYVPLILNVTTQLWLPVAATNPTHTTKKPQCDDSCPLPSTQQPAERKRLRRDEAGRAAELLGTPGAFLTRTHLRELGLERRAVDAVFRALPVVKFPDYSRTLVRVSDYLALVEASTYQDDRVRPT